MVIIRFDPFTFPGVFSKFPSLWNEDEWPVVSMNEGLDVYETDNEVVAKAAVPGVLADKVEETFEDGVLLKPRFLSGVFILLFCFLYSTSFVQATYSGYSSVFPFSFLTRSQRLFDIQDQGKRSVYKSQQNHLCSPSMSLKQYEVCHTEYIL